VQNVTRTGEQYVVVPYPEHDDEDPSSVNPVDLFDENELGPP
jgi:hypothetical protein